MECPCGWTVVFVLCTVQGAIVFSQNVAHRDDAGHVFRESRDCSRSSANPISADLFNSILTVAASNGVLPDLLPMLQGQPIVDNHQRLPYAQDALTKPLSVVPMPSSTCGNTQEQIIFSGQPLMPSTPNQNFKITPLTYGTNCQSNGTPQTFPPSAVPSCMPQIAQAVSVENYPTCAQNAGTGRPTPIILQPQCQFGEVNPYNIYNQIVEPISLAELNTQPLNLAILPPSQFLPTINTCSGVLEIPSNLSPYLTKPSVLTTDGQQLPLNLQINVPTPSVPAPKITVVSATPSNVPVSPPTSCCSDYPANVQPYQYPPQPPLVIGGSSKSSWRNLLPILLMAMFSDRGCNNGGDCCCCCHTCNSGNSGNNIPIPYPIPIPINNPIVNTCPYSSRKYRDDGDDDDDT